jgi:hypothetical protein
MEFRNTPETVRKPRKPGGNMSNTINLLEIIGNDASLRFASADELANTLERLGASEALKAAVSSGDRSHLSQELGHRVMHHPQITHAFG